MQKLLFIGLVMLCVPLSAMEIERAASKHEEEQWIETDIIKCLDVLCNDLKNVDDTKRIEVCSLIPHLNGKILQQRKEMLLPELQRVQQLLLAQSPQQQAQWVIHFTEAFNVLDDNYCGTKGRLFSQYLIDYVINKILDEGDSALNDEFVTEIYVRYNIENQLKSFTYGDEDKKTV